MLLLTTLLFAAAAAAGASSLSPESCSDHTSCSKAILDGTTEERLLTTNATVAERQQAIAAAVRVMLAAIGEDPGREGLLKTPARVAKALLDNTQGYEHRGTSVDDLVNGAKFNVSHYGEMVIVKDISVFSMCEHHMLPFFGIAHIGYVPNGTVIGLSKLARIAHHYARRLQVRLSLDAVIDYRRID
jgi:GTP cyclohydrolase I